MTLQTASTAKTASDGVSIFTDMTNSLIVGDINTLITDQSTTEDTEETIYRASIDIDCVASDGQPIKLIQSDLSEVNLYDVEQTLRDKGYRTHVRIVVTREGKNDKVKLQVAWN